MNTGRILIGTRIGERITRLLLWHHIVGQQERVRLGHIVIHQGVQQGIVELYQGQAWVCWGISWQPC